METPTYLAGGGPMGVASGTRYTKFQKILERRTRLALSTAMPRTTYRLVPSTVRHWDRIARPFSPTAEARSACRTIAASEAAVAIAEGDTKSAVAREVTALRTVPPARVLVVRLRAIAVSEAAVAIAEGDTKSAVAREVTALRTVPARVPRGQCRHGRRRCVVRDPLMLLAIGITVRASAARD
jgi:hypothetical protein